MKANITILKAIILFFLISKPTLNYSQSTATYDITFTSVWNSTDHGTLPGGAHWSPLVGANHNGNVTFLQMDQNATPGIENVSELGDNGVFNTEVNTSITNGNTEQYINGNDLGTATGTININGLEVDESFPLLTLVSMIAPSPDWMIAISGINLRNTNSWKSSITLDLFPYDAGTDNGMNYTSSNSNTNPQDPISSLQNVSPFNSQKIGTLTISLVSVLSVDDLSFSERIKIYPNPISSNIINVKTSNLGEDITYSIANLLGQNILKGNLLNEQINVGDLSSGTYVIILKNKSQKTVKKFVMQ
jgi:spondin N/type IX secretion system substrate protein